MKKSVYSIVLMDDVIQAVDQMAYQLHTSRSNLINQILAEHVALITPEMQMKNVFDTIEELFGTHQHFQIQQQAAECMMSIKSVLRYKYNPTIRYAINLNREQHEHLGELKLISRSQSLLLLGKIEGFLKLWTTLERSDKRRGWQIEPGGKWTRVLEAPVTPENEEDIAEAITAYIKAVDQGLKIYFECMNDQDHGEKYIHQHFRNYTAKGGIKV